MTFPKRQLPAVEKISEIQQTLEITDHDEYITNMQGIY